MDKLLAVLSFLTFVGVCVMAFPDGFAGIVIVLIFGGLTIYLIHRNTEEPAFLTRLFIMALLTRIIVGTFIHLSDLRDFFGGDAVTYDSLGFRLTEIWFNNASKSDPLSLQAMNMSSGWGMNYITGFVYSFTGRNILAPQFLIAVVGAAISPLIYACSYKIFYNKRVAQVSAILAAFFPAFVIWTSQLLKDGLIIFLLIIVMIMVLQLQEKFTLTSVWILIFSLFGIISFRFYIFYMVSIAVAGSFVIGLSNTTKSLITRASVLVIIGVSLTYLGVIRNATTEFDTFGNMDRIQNSRQDLVKSADSGFSKDADISTANGAILAIPIGFIYLMFAPFPWQVASLRQTFAAPETLIWWGMMPFLVSGIWYTIKFKLRAAIPILIFTLMLTIAYSIFQGNIGTAYRQRTQIQVFLFIFIAVGLTMYWERRENRMLQTRKHNQQTNQFKI